MTIFSAFDKSLKKEAATEANLVQITNALSVCYTKTFFLPKNFPENTNDLQNYINRQQAES